MDLNNLVFCMWIVPVVRGLTVAPNQPNVCKTSVSVNETITASYIKREKIKTLTWCLGIPPRCTKWRTHYRTSYRTVTRQTQQEVYECCQGFQAVQTNPLKCTAVCNEALGMQNGDIPDSALSSSSEFDNINYAVQYSRLGTSAGGGAWCPERRIKTGVYEWIQIDMPTLYRITAVATQGRYSNGTGQEWTSEYTIQYQRFDGGRWRTYMNLKKAKVIIGNVETNSIVKRQLEPALVLRRIRFVPFSDIPRTVCMRVELYGCRWKAGVVSYDMPQGGHYNELTSFLDLAYDGHIKHGLLSNGIGQLVDGAEGSQPIRESDNSSILNRHGWVGWQNDDKNKYTKGGLLDESVPLEIFFQFDTLRSFYGVYIFMSHIIGNNVSDETTAFSKIVLHFSVGGRFFQTDPVVFVSESGLDQEDSYYVFIPISPRRKAQFVNIRLSYQAEWLLISEVIFDSAIVQEADIGRVCTLPNMCDCDPCLQSLCLPVADISISPRVAIPEIQGDLCKVNVSWTETHVTAYVTSERITEMTWCLAVPPRCKIYRTKYETRYHLSRRNITRAVIDCCAGYEWRHEHCCPMCKDCGGRCVAPGVCLSPVL